MERRRFINTAFRSLIFTGIASMSGYLLFREKNSDEQCGFEFICKDCKVLNNCSLPEAKKYLSGGE